MKHPFHQIHLYEIGSRLFCGKKGKPIPALFGELEKKAPFVWADEIWLMGVWKNSPSSRKIAQTMPELQPDFHNVKSSLEPEDIYGSPYAIYDYVPDPLITKTNDLTEIYEWFQSKNKKLILDFVPNHMAIDTPLVKTYPHLFLKAEVSNDLKNTFLHPNGQRYFHGRDPYFDGWTDTIQWDFSNPEVEVFHIQILRHVAKQCDGVRCDMAMLPLPDVFEKTHGKSSVYNWQTVIRTIKSEFPEFKFYAEVYWGLEETLLSLGFDATYDKDLYDAMYHKELPKINEILRHPPQRNRIQFLENHDEKRAKQRFGEQNKTYFSLLQANPNIILFHDGQELGYRKKIPVQMIQADEETPNLETLEFYQRVFSVVQKRGKTIHYEETNYSEFNQFPIFTRLIHSKNQTELFLWNYQNTTVSGWIPYQEGIFYQKELKDLVSGNIFPQEKNKEGIYYKLEPNQLQWFIF